jgi:hypothetical protein
MKKDTEAGEVGTCFEKGVGNDMRRLVKRVFILLIICCSMVVASAI